MSLLSTINSRGVFASRPAAAAANEAYLYFATDTGVLYRSNGSSWDTFSATASLTNPMTTAEDLIKGGVSGTPGRLAAGNAGAHLAMINGVVAWNAGTVFPTAVAGDRYFRTDRGIEYYYDGTRWLSAKLYLLEIGVSGEAVLPLAATASSAWRTATFNDVYDLWLVDWYGMSFVNTTNDGTKFWTLTLRKETKGAAYATTDIASFTTGTGPDPVGQFTVHTVAVNALLGTAHGTLVVAPTKTSTPGTLLFHSNLTFRLVG